MIDPPPLNRPLQNLIGGLKIKCVHSDSKEGGGQQEPPTRRRRTTGSGEAVEGEAKEPEVCKWEGPVSEYHQHVKSCPFRIVYCTFCFARIEHRFLEHHETAICPYRIITCGKCGEKVRFRMVSVHNRYSCPEVDVKCEHCNLQMKRKELGKGGEQDPLTDNCINRFTGHYKVCPKYPIRCEFWNVGCRHRGPREEIRAHHADEARYHARLVSDAFHWKSASVSWIVDPSLVVGTESVIIDSPQIIVEGIPCNFLARLHLEGESLKIELCIVDPTSEGVRRPSLFFRAISITSALCAEAIDEEEPWFDCKADDFGDSSSPIVKSSSSSRSVVKSALSICQRETETGPNGETEKMIATRKNILGGEDWDESRYEEVEFRIDFQVKVQGRQTLVTLAPEY